MALFTRENLVSSKRIYDGHVINLRVDSLELPEGGKTLREFVEHNGGVVICCQPEPDRVILLKQYRYCIDEDLIELPAGRIEKGEPPLPAAQRELTEETGYAASSWREMCRLYTAPGFCNEILYLYHATNTEYVGRDLDYDEEAEVMVLSFDEAWQMFLEGKIRDAKTVAGLAFLNNSKPV